MKRVPLELPSPPTALLVALSVPLAAVAGAAALEMRSVVVLAGAAATMLLVSAFGAAVDRAFLFSLCFLLTGYAIQGRGFAYFGFPPLYAGELVLATGLAVFVVCRVNFKLSGLHLLLLSFMGLGLIHTVRFYPVYGLDAIRDAALWYYAAFAILLSFILTESRIRSGMRIYGSLLPLVVLLLPLLSILLRVQDFSLPHFPGSPLPIISVMKAGDQGVVLAGLAAFMLTGLYDFVRKNQSRLPTAAFWAIWSIGAVVVSVGNRGGMLAMLASLSAIVLLRPSRRVTKAVLIGLVLLGALVIVNPVVDLENSREVSVQQLVTNFLSVFSDEVGGEGSIQATKDWRLNWWSEIYQYTVEGPYFWTGKGFGINLADDDGFQVLGDQSLRSPHNGHMTVLARMGVPGFALWIMFNLWFARNVLQAMWRTQGVSDKFLSAFFAWIFVYWLAIMVESTFDVYLESPQGGIWYWTIIGVGLAGLRVVNVRWKGISLAPDSRASSINGSQFAP